MATSSTNATGLSTALETMTPELLIEIILQQQTAIEELRAEVARLKGQQRTDSKTSSKPPSTDLLKKSEHKADARLKKPAAQAGRTTGPYGENAQGLQPHRPNRVVTSRALPSMRP